MSKTAEEIVTLRDQLKTERKNFEDVWSDIVEYVIPRRTQMELTAEKGTRHDSLIYDGTAIDALKLLSDGMQGYLVSSSYKWFSLRMEDPRLEDMPVIVGWLQEVEHILYGVLNRSNFYRQIHEYFMDGASFGTATIYSEFDSLKSRVNFSTRHPKEVFIQEDQFGAVDVVVRNYMMTARQMVATFDSVHRDIVELAEKNPEAQQEIVHYVGRRENWDPTQLKSEDKEFESKYVDVAHKEELRSSGYDLLPYAVWRFYKNSDEPYGRSPAWNALGDIKGIQAYSEANTLAAQMSVRPPLSVPEEMRGRVRFVPGAMNYYETDPAKTITPLPTGINYPIGIDREDRKREAINKHFMVDFFLLIARAEKEMTATEIREKQEEKAVVLGPTINGLENECLDPVIDRLFYIAMEQNWLPPPPQVLVEHVGSRIKIDYMGPLAQAQRRFFMNQPYRNTLMEVVPLLQISPEVADNFDWDEMSRDIAEANDLPQKAFVSKEMVAKIRERRLQQMQKDKQMETMERMGKAAPGLGKAAEEGSALEAIEKTAAEAVPTGVG